MTGRILALATAIACAGLAMPAETRAPKKSASPAPDPIGKGRYGTLAIQSAGSESSLAFDDRTLGRPFGAELVDTLEVTAPYWIGPRDIYLVKGSRGADCPARYVAVAVDRSTDKEAAPRVSQPFGTCALPSSARIDAGTLTLTMADAGGRPVRYTWIDGAMRADTDAALLAAAATGTLPCRLYRRTTGADPQEAKALLASFESDYPADLRKRRKVEKAELTAARLQELVSGLACLATWPGAEPVVPQTAAPLFASKRYGGQAFALLDAIDQSPATSEPMRAAVRSFAAQMQFEVARL